VRLPLWFHCDAPAVCAASEARPSEGHARRQLARTGRAKEGCFQPLAATSKGRERLVRKPTARMTFAMPRFATRIDVRCSGRRGGYARFVTWIDVCCSRRPGAM